MTLEVLKMSDAALRYDVFISYSRRDAALVESLVTRLAHEAGLRVWLDRARLQPGFSWRAEIETAMNESAAALIVWGPSDLGPVQRQERDLAYVLRDVRPDFHVLYVFLPGTPPPQGTWANVDTWLRFASSVDESDTFAQLVAALKGEAPPTLLVADLPDDPAPYRGLSAFGVHDARFFFGRSGDVEEMLERLPHHPFLAVLGPSGSGKTSLVQAGLLARLHSDALPGRVTWSWLLLRPGPHPLRSLATALTRLQSEGDPLLVSDSILRRLQADPTDLPIVLQTLLPPQGQVVLVVDRLEELFILCQAEEERRAFLGALLALVQHPHRPAWIVATMRADFYGHLGPYADLAGQVVHHQLYLKPMGQEEVAEVIEAPAAQVGAIFEKGLAMQVRADTQVRGEVALPLLQHTLELLWRKRRGRWLTWDAYQEVGGVEGALRYHADRVIEGLSQEEQKVARQLFTRLIWLEERAGAIAGRRMDKTALVEQFTDARTAERVLQGLADERLVVLRGEGERASAELVHDTLPLHWDRLRAWVQADQEFLLWRQRLRGALAEWVRTGRDAGALLRGPSLVEAERWLSERPDDLISAEKGFIQESITLRQREHLAREQLRWRITFGLAAGLLVALLLTGLAIVQWRRAETQRDEAVRQREVARGRQLRAEAQRLGVVDRQWTTAVLLAIESLHKAADANSYELLWKLATAGVKPVARYITKGGGAPVVFSPDGGLVAVGDDDALIVFQARSGQEVKRVPFRELARFIGFRAAGDQIVAAGEDSVRVFDLATEQEVARLDDAAQKKVFGFSPNGQFLAMASGTHTQVVEVFKQRVLRTAEHPEAMTKVVVSADGKHVVLASEHKASLLDTTTGHWITLPERRGTISTIAFSADGTLVAVASYGKNEEVVILDVATGLERDRLASGSSRAWFSKQGSFLVTQPEYTTLLVRDFHAGVDLTRIKLLDSVSVLDWSQDGELLAVGTHERDGSTSVFQTGSWRRLARLKPPGSVRIEAVAISPHGDLVASRANRRTTVFEAYQGRPLVHMQHPGEPTRVAFSADGKIAAGVFDHNTVVVFEADKNHKVARLERCDRAVRALTVSADGRLVAAGCYDGRARIIDVLQDKIISEVPHRYTSPLAFSADGRLVFAVPPKGATVFEATSGREVRVLGGDSISAVALSDTGKYVVVASRGAYVFETSGQRGSRQLNAGDLIESVAFSPDGKLLALGVRDRSVSVYKVDTWQHVAELHHKDEEKEIFQVRSVVFSSDGTLLASVTENPTRSEQERGATLRVFDVRLATELIRVPLHETPLFMGFSPDRAFLEIAVGNKHIRLERFPLRVQDLIEDACARVGRNLTAAEWSRYMEDTPYRVTCPKLNPAAVDVQ
jgi:WD40 repeat protein